MIRIGSVDELQEVLLQIHEFEDPYPKEEFKKRLNEQTSLILVAEKDGKLLGFKCGYERDSSTFYSWMGGVISTYRREGFAERLLEAMEKWCRIKGYKKLIFKTLNKHKHMLLFSIKNNFEIIEVEKSNKDPHVRIWLAKDL